MDKKLCYIEDNFAYFTSNFKEQWGDDWNDKPYEHNAGEPYTDNECKIEKLAFSCELETPAEIAGNNSPYSVEDINKGETPWLSGESYETEEVVEIFAGITMENFIEAIVEIGGEIYLKLDQ